MTEPSNYLDRLNKLDTFISEALKPKEEFYTVQMLEAHEKKYKKEILSTTKNRSNIYTSFSFDSVVFSSH